MFTLTTSHVLEQALPRAEIYYVFSLTTKVTLRYLRYNRSELCWLINDDFSLGSGSLLGFKELMLRIFTIFCLLSKLWLWI
jgi:hypothetical protein